ncbi:MAG TPA: hydrogenase maturation protease [Sedimentisphaerales bacterium]|nr:hydrogenase maturation protease [Sedimentisphaerales bacterium]
MIGNPENKKVLVAGLGNPLMGDEGIGNYLITKLEGLSERWPLAEFIDAGTGGMSLLHIIAGWPKVIFVDCAFMRCPPGAMKKFTPDQVQSVKTLAHQSLHEADILKVIELSAQLEQSHQEIVFFGIEPEKVELKQALSESLSAHTDNYIKTICREIEIST